MAAQRSTLLPGVYDPQKPKGVASSRYETASPSLPASASPSMPATLSKSTGYSPSMPATSYSPSLPASASPMGSSPAQPQTTAASQPATAPTIATPASPSIAPWLATAPSSISVNMGGSSVGAPQTVTAPATPTFSVSPAAQAMIDQYVTNTQQQGSQELQRQLQTDILPSLKAAAAANGQVNADGTVNGAFLENLSRQQQQSGRELANIVLGAQTSGLEKGLQQGQFEMDQASKGADRTLQASIENAKNQLTATQIASNERLQQAQLSLQAQVESGRLSQAQAQLAFETAKAESENAVQQQQLRLGMLNLLSGNQLETAKLGLGAVSDAYNQRNTNLSLLKQLGSQDLVGLLDAIQAVKAGGQTTTQSGNLLGDILGVGMAVAPFV